MNTADLKRRRVNIGPVAAAFCAALLAIPGPAAAASLAVAARNGDIAAVRAQLKAGTDANEVESDGSSALLWAAYQSSPELAALLLESKADPNLANEFGVTPLLQASRNGDVATMRALLD
ncbi:MAG TPA: ankyrin repeat domain-containing protein, partial [Gammaproteobacteria bacterium]|nr:ankyrin repeat domain-containing protein [Gammaproteobacteria bacterium]